METNENGNIETEVLEPATGDSGSLQENNEAKIGKEGTVGLHKRKIIIVSVSLAVIIMGLLASILVYSNTGERLVVKQLMLGEKYLSELNYDKAVVAFSKVIKVDPRNEKAYLGLADSYIGLGDIEKAIETLDEGYQNVPESTAIQEKLVTSWISLGEMQMKDQNYEEALHSFQSASMLDPGNINASLGLANAYMGRGDLDEAINQLNDSAASNPESEEINLALELVEQRDELAQTVAEVNEILDSAVEGEDEGEYPYGAKAELESVSNEAEKTLDNLESNLEDIQIAEQSLQTAIDDFKSKVVPPEIRLIYGIDFFGKTVKDAIQNLGEPDGRLEGEGGYGLYWDNHGEAISVYYQAYYSQFEYTGAEKISAIRLSSGEVSPGIKVNATLSEVKQLFPSHDILIFDHEDGPEAAPGFSAYFQYNSNWTIEFVWSDGDTTQPAASVMMINKNNL